MKKINFILTLIVFMIGINSFIYIDILKSLIAKTSDAYLKVTILDVYINIFIAFMIGTIMSFILTKLNTRVSTNKILIIIIFIIYSIFWVFTSYIIVHGYIQYFGHTWLETEIFNFVLYQKNFYIAYILSFILVIFLSLFNKKDDLS